jgi:magnesium transporter
MLAILKTTPTGLARLQEFEPGSWIDLVNPTEEELERVSRELLVPLDLLRGPLDEEEKSRIDVEDEMTHIIVDIPVVVRGEDQRGYETIPLGILLHPDYLITTCLRPNPILGEFERGAVRGFTTYWKTRFLLQILQHVSAFYLRYLGRIDRDTDKVERELRASMKNAEIFDLLGLQKSLVYFTTSLRSNEAVLQKLARIKTIKMYEDDEDLLEDVVVENRQASEPSPSSCRSPRSFSPSGGKTSWSRLETTSTAFPSQSASRF